MEDETLRVEGLDPSELERAALVLARAFRDNPLNVAVIGGDPKRRLRSNGLGMRALLPTAARLGLVLGARDPGGLVGALVATPPCAHPLPPPPVGTRLGCLVGQGWRVARRWAKVFRALDRIHPVEPHWYLGSVGVEPGQRRQGVGAALLRRFLTRVDEERMPAYLETDREANLPFYAREGFEVVGQTEILGTAVWPMSRSARRT